MRVLIISRIITSKVFDISQSLSRRQITLIQSNLDYSDSLGLDNIDQIIEGQDNQECEY